MFDMETYRQDLFDVFEGTELDTYIPTPEEDRMIAMEGLKDKVKGVYDKGLQTTDKVQADWDDKVDKFARSKAKSPEQRAKEQGKQFPDNTDYMDFNKEVNRIKAVLTAAKGVIWTVAIIVPPGTIPVILMAAAKIAVVDNAPLMNDFITGKLSLDEITNRSAEIVAEVSKIHRELGMVIDKLNKITIPISKNVANGLVGISKVLGVSIDKFKTAASAASAASLVAALKAMSKKYCAEASKVEKAEKAGAVKESVEEFSESAFEKEEMDLITQLKFAAFENVTDYNPYTVLDEFVEKCNYDNEYDYNLLLEAFDFVLAL